MAKNENMKTFRIGNEIQVRWPILTNGEETSLSGRDLTLILSDQWGNDREVKTFGTEGNVIVFTFLASEQFKTGVYRLTLYENYGKLHQIATDYCFAFKLVAHSCDIPSDMSSSELPLDSTNVDVGIHGLSAYEIAVNYGYEGSEEQWMEEFHTVLSSTQLIVESVATAEHVLQRTEQLFNDLSEIQQAEQGRVSNEEARVLAEQGRDHAEGLRQSAEEERQRQEQTRQSQEQQRQETFVANEQQRSQTFQQSQSQRQQTFEGSEQQRSQTFAASEEQRTESFTGSENTRQQTFENNESQRESRLSEVISDVEAAERLRVEAENQRDADEADRKSSESTRRLNENTRQQNETIRGTNESTRRSNENVRVQHEQERVEDELQRQRNEDLRVQQDNVIAEAERLRSGAETRRVSSENARVVAEQGRVQAELLRVNAELERERNTQAAIDGIEAQITAKHEEYQETLNGAISEAQEDVSEAIADFNRTKIVLQTESEVEINPNVKNIWRTAISELTITFAAGDFRYDDEYMIQFTCPANAGTILHLPSTLRWADDNPISPEPSNTYQISVVDNLAIFAGWEAATV